MITDSDFLSEFSTYVSDIGTDYMMFVRSGPNTVAPMQPQSWDPTTGELFFTNKRNQLYSGSYAEFALSGNLKMVRTFPNASFSIDYTNQSYVYKPQNSDPSGAYLPTVPQLLKVINGSSGITLENMTFIGGCGDHFSIYY